MHLRRLDMHGFKSFAKKSSLLFTAPITSIVGPNGSGKSNVVEAIRFVLGEQSMKSLRGKGGTDLIFKGSKSISAMGRASVSLTFDNKDRIFSYTGSDQNRAELAYDEVTITREVYADGANKYLINGTEVRLKDIVEMMASVNIGTSGHHIISQGEADRILNANARERRGMVEDALGLKVYQYKMRDSERKLEKALANMKEVQSLRREIAPHLAFLKKQVEKIEKAREMREEVKGLYKTYLSREAGYLRQEAAELARQKEERQSSLSVLEEKIRGIEASRGEARTETGTPAVAESIASARTALDGLSRKLGRLEGMIELEERRLSKPAEAGTEKPVPLSAIREMAADIQADIDRVLAAESMDAVRASLSAVKQRLSGFISRYAAAPAPAPDTSGLSALKEEHAALLEEARALREKESSLQEESRRLEAERRAEEARRREGERAYYALVAERNELRSKGELLAVREAALEERKARFEEEIREGAVLVGPDAVRHEAAADGNVDRAAQEELRRKIERIKIKLEDIGGGGGGDVIKEYEDTKARDEFLVRELGDIEASIASLRELIHELKATLDREFKQGVEKINRQFQDFFALMFGGGTAFLSIIVEHKRSRKNAEELEEEESGLSFEEGIEINVSMPHKKVKELQMLSGGERSLTSIALLFAISQVNPPPFLVLDETDAALDEANSRKYGDMLESLSEYSQLVVVTHNRETMSRAQVLYGVTVGGDGASKLLSIKFDEAAAIAK